MSKHVLHKQSMALINYKGGAGKSILTANLAAIAAREMNWRVVVIDLDSSAPLTHLALGGLAGISTIQEALEVVKARESCTDILRYSKQIGCWVLPGSIKSLAEDLILTIPQLILEIKHAHFSGGYVDLVLVDAPGENREINNAVLAGIDLVAMPLALASMDMASTGITLKFLNQMQAKRNGQPGFLGMVPNRIARKGVYEREFLATLEKAGALLPYIPESNTIKSSFHRSKDDQILPIHFSPNAKATKRLVQLFDALNAPVDNSAKWTKELKDYLGIENASAAVAENDISSLTRVSQ